MPNTKSITRLLLAAFATLALCGCGQLGYYAQAAHGQLSLLSKRQPVEKLLADETTDPRLRQQLELARRIRLFGMQRLDLRNNDTFSQYADLDRQHVLWNVVAAPHLSVDPKTWCFPIAGCVSYRGYFREAAARANAVKTAETGYDTFVYGVSAYSTLGWFDDPLLNTFIYFSEPGLAAMIFHELSHQTVYFKDDSAFNEAFATAVEYHLLEQWLVHNQRTDMLRQVTALREKQVRITGQVLDYRQRLTKLYASSVSDQQKLATKDSLFSELESWYEQARSRGKGTPYYDWWFDQPLNNALLLTVSTYFSLVPAISELIDDAQGNLPAFIASVKKHGPAILDSN